MAIPKSRFIELSSTIVQTSMLIIQLNLSMKIERIDRRLILLLIIIFEVKYLIKLIIEETFYRATPIFYFIGLTKCCKWFLKIK